MSLKSWCKPPNMAMSLPSLRFMMALMSHQLNWLGCAVRCCNSYFGFFGFEFQTFGVYHCFCLGIKFKNYSPPRHWRAARKSQCFLLKCGMDLNWRLLLPNPTECNAKWSLLPLSCSYATPTHQSAFGPKDIQSWVHPDNGAFLQCQETRYSDICVVVVDVVGPLVGAVGSGHLRKCDKLTDCLGYQFLKSPPEIIFDWKHMKS